MTLLLAWFAFAEPHVPVPGQASVPGGTPIAEVRTLLAAHHDGLELRLSPLPRAWTAEEIEGLVHKLPDARNLRVLDVSGNPIGAAGAKAIAASPYLGGLLRLDVTGCKVEEAGARGLAYSEGLGALQELRLGTGDTNERGLAELRARYGERLQVR